MLPETNPTRRVSVVDFITKKTGFSPVKLMKNRFPTFWLGGLASRRLAVSPFGEAFLQFQGASEGDFLEALQYVQAPSLKLECSCFFRRVRYRPPGFEEREYFGFLSRQAGFLGWNVLHWKVVILRY